MSRPSAANRWTSATVVAILLAVTIVGVLFPAVSAAPTESTPSLSLGGNATEWSYGNVSFLNVSEIGPHGGQFSGSITYGFVANLSETSTSANTTEIALQETVGLTLSVHDCRTNCSNPIEEGNYYYRAYQTYDAWTNLTDQATVLATTVGAPPTTVAAIGVLNSSSVTHAGLNETVSDISGASHAREHSLNASASYDAGSSVAFATPLGILPVGSISPGESWTSTAAYNANSSWDVAWSVAVNGGSAVSGGSSGGGPVRAGLALLTGTAGGAFVRIHTMRLVAVQYGIRGGLSLVGGLAIAPNLPQPFAGDFGGQWSVDTNAFGSVELSSVFANPAGTLSQPIESASAQFSTGVVDPNNGGLNNSFGNSTVNGTPMTPAEASATSACLVSGTCTAATTGGGTGLGALGGSLGWLIGIGAAAVVVVLVAVLVVGRNRRLPPPQYPNANLYPVGGAVGTPPASSRDGTKSPGTPATPPSEDDPLSQLW